MEGVRRHIISDVRRGGDLAGELARLSLDAGGAPRDDDAMLTGVSSFLAPSPIGVQSPAVDDAFEAYAASLSDRDPESPANRSPAEADTPSPLRARSEPRRRAEARERPAPRPHRTRETSTETSKTTARRCLDCGRRICRRLR